MLLAVARFDCQSESRRGRYAALATLDVGRGRVDLLERGSDGGIVIERVLQRLLERQRRRRVGAADLRARGAVKARPPQEPRRDEFVSSGNSGLIYYRIPTIVNDNDSRA